MNINEIRSSHDWIEFALTHKSSTMQQVAADQKLDQAMKNAISGLPRFDYDGNDNAIIIYVGAEPSRFQPDELVLCMYLWNPEQGKGDWWRGSLSENFIQVGNNAGKSYKQNTIEILQKIGYDTHAVGGFGGLPQMVGQNIPIWIKRVDKDGRTYFNIGSIGNNFEVPASVSLSSIKLGAPGAQPAAFGQPPQAQQQAQQQPTPFQQPQPAQQQYQQQPVFGQPPQQQQAQHTWGAPQQASPYSGFGQQPGGLI